MNFTATFTAAFDILNRDNFVSLVDLRRAMPHVSRDDFDRGLYDLRCWGLYDLSAAEGRNGITDAERDAAVREGDSLLLHCHRT